MSLLVLSADDVQTIASSFSPQHLEDLMANVFTLLSSGSTEYASPLRTGIQMDNHTALFMPARIDSVGTSVKVVSVPSSSDDKRGLPASTLILDKDTGAVKAIVNARSLTALRNAAGSLLSTKLVGMTNPKNIVAFGAGKQIEAHVELHIKAFPTIAACTIVNRSSSTRTADLLQYLQSRFPTVAFDLILSGAKDSVEKSLSTASLVICATSSQHPLFPSAWISDGTHVILIGSYKPYMHEVDGDLIKRSLLQPHCLIVDSKAACLSEAGELIDAKVEGSKLTEIGVLKQHLSALQPGTVTIFKSVGIGLQDVAIAHAVVEQAIKLNIGVTVANYDTASR